MKQFVLLLHFLILTEAKNGADFDARYRAWLAMDPEARDQQMEKAFEYYENWVAIPRSNDTDNSNLISTWAEMENMPDGHEFDLEDLFEKAFHDDANEQYFKRRECIRQNKCK